MGCKGIIDYNGKMYLWSGYGGTNDMLILDTINLSWKIGSLVGAPTARYYYGATLLPNQNIIYMGKQVIVISILFIFIFLKCLLFI